MNSLLALLLAFVGLALCCHAPAHRSPAVCPSQLHYLKKNSNKQACVIGAATGARKRLQRRESRNSWGLKAKLRMSPAGHSGHHWAAFMCAGDNAGAEKMKSHSQWSVQKIAAQIKAGVPASDIFDGGAQPHCGGPKPGHLMVQTKSTKGILSKVAVLLPGSRVWTIDVFSRQTLNCKKHQGKIPAPGFTRRTWLWGGNCFTPPRAPRNIVVRAPPQRNFGGDGDGGDGGDFYFEEKKVYAKRDISVDGLNYEENQGEENEADFHMRSGADGDGGDGGGGWHQQRLLRQRQQQAARQNAINRARYLAALKKSRTCDWTQRIVGWEDYHFFCLCGAIVRVAVRKVFSTAGAFRAHVAKKGLPPGIKPPKAKGKLATMNQRRPETYMDVTVFTNSGSHSSRKGFCTGGRSNVVYSEDMFRCRVPKTCQPKPKKSCPQVQQKACPVCPPQRKCPPQRRCQQTQQKACPVCPPQRKCPQVKQPQVQRPKTQIVQKARKVVQTQKAKKVVKVPQQVTHRVPSQAIQVQQPMWLTQNTQKAQTVQTSRKVAAPVQQHEPFDHLPKGFEEPPGFKGRWEKQDQKEEEKLVDQDDFAWDDRK